MRDRDAGGRPLNARPRDRLGRPLPRGSTGVEPPGAAELVPGPDGPAPGPALVQAQRLLDAGYPFHAHEVLEAAWKGAPAAERDLWQGLAQLAVGLTHLLRGNPTGAAAVLRRAQERIARFADDPPHGLDVAGLLEWAGTVRAVAESPGGGAPAHERAIAPPRLRPAAGDDAASSG
jgi:hypothetical protein